MVASICEAVRASASVNPVALALGWEGATRSYAELLEDASAGTAWLIGRGIAPGDRVGIGLPNSPELVSAVLAVLAAGGVVVPLNPNATADEVSYVVGDAGCQLVIAHPVQAETLGRQQVGGASVVTGIGRQGGFGEPARRRADDPALIVYTSGTTGRPKGAVLSNGALLSNLEAVRHAWKWTAEDRLLLTLPCFHLHGLALGILGSLLAGSGIVLRPRFVADDVLHDITRHRITLFFGVPTMYNRLVGLAESTCRGLDLSSMRLWVSGSAPLTAATFERFEARFGHQILERFGMSEGGFMISAPYDEPRRPGVVGRPLSGIDIRIIDPDSADRGELRDVDGEQGELVIRGSNLFSGYWNRPEETARAFIGDYFRSGDLAVREADGMIRITGRRSVDIIKSRGFKVSAVEIENQLQAHPAVREVAVVGIPDADVGERIVAVLTAAPGIEVDADELRAFARAHLAPHKVPAEFRFVEEIPSTGPGKFAKRRIIEQLSGGAPHR